jgi:tRNA(Ile)-lysidine synthase
MLSVSRRQIEDYVAGHGITPRSDSSNQDRSYSRNFIRHELMPLILSRFPSALNRIENFTGLARIDDQYLELAAHSVFSENFLHENEWNADWLSALPKALLHRVITMALYQRQIEASSVLVVEIANLLCPAREHISCDSRFSIDKTWDIQRSANQIRWLNKTPAERAVSLEFPVRVPGTTVIPALGKALHIEQCFDPEERMKYKTEFGFQIRVDLGLSKTDQPLILRRREAGDYIQPFGMNDRVSLKKYLHTHKARRFASICCERLDRNWSVQSCIVLASGQEIFWIPGVGMSEKLRVRSSASYILRFLSLEPDRTNIC